MEHRLCPNCGRPELREIVQNNLIACRSCDWIGQPEELVPLADKRAVQERRERDLAQGRL